MPGKDEQQLSVFSYVSRDSEFRKTTRCASCGAMTDEALQQLQARFNKLYAKTGRPPIALPSR
jgi:hypothetical protein